MTSNDTDDADDARPNRRVVWMTGVLAVLAVPAAVVWWPGCRQYPPLSTPEGVTLGQALYTVCDSRDPALIPKFEKRLAEVEAAGKLTPDQAAAFRDILGTAKAGDWDRAKAAAYRFAQDQVR